MYNKNVLTTNGKKLYLATFEFVCGEYEQIFEKAFYAKNPKGLEKQIHLYLKNYYGAGNTSEIDGTRYYYWNGEVGVKLDGWEEIADFEQLVYTILRECKVNKKDIIAVGGEN